MYKRWVKRLLDILAVLLLLLLLFPIIMLVFVFLFVINRGNVIFIQYRPGKNERIFKLYKFKTMGGKQDKEGNLLPDEERLTPIGRWIRKMSLDELPQLINVLKGDMSLIGPRPWLVTYLPLYNSFQRRRHQIRPGITGWAQVNGRNKLSWKNRFDYDIYYVDNVSFLLDTKIVGKTIWNVVTSKGVLSEKSEIMHKFEGGGE